MHNTESLYASECRILNTAKELDEIEKKERKILRKIIELSMRMRYGKIEVMKKFIKKQRIVSMMRMGRVAFY